MDTDPTDADEPCTATPETDADRHRRLELRSSVPANVEVELPPEVWEREGHREGEALTAALLDYLTLEYRFTVDGDEVHRTAGYDDAEPVADGGVSAEARALADAIGYDAGSLQAAAEAVGESPGEFVRTAVAFRDGALNMAEFRQYVDEAVVADEFVDA